MTSDLFAHALIASGYKDYRAARLLINNLEISQVLILASSAIEKNYRAEAKGLSVEQLIKGLF